MKALSALCALGLLLCAAPAEAGEEGAYKRVRRALDHTRKNGTDANYAWFLQAAEEYLRQPEAPRAARVLAWRGDLFRDRDPHLAYTSYAEAYRRGGDEDHRRKSRELQFLREGPPPLDAAAWVGAPVDPSRPDDRVTLVAFFSVSHPKRRRFLSYLVRLQGRYRDRGLRVIGVAAVIDDHQNQSPAALTAWLARQRLPFPVAVDRQVAGRRSLSFRAWRCRALPWAVVVDRLGRVRWCAACGTGGNIEARAEAILRATLAAPGPGDLLRRLRRGGAPAAEALHQLDTLRTRPAVNVLFVAADGPLRPAVRSRVRRILERALPRELAGLDLDTARSRWRTTRDRYRYSLPAHRQVQRPAR